MKFSARNIFFGLFEKFRPLYNNFRNDHVMLRALTTAPGFVTIGKEKLPLNFFQHSLFSQKYGRHFSFFSTRLAEVTQRSMGKKLNSRSAGK